MKTISCLFALMAATASEASTVGVFDTDLLLRLTSSVPSVYLQTNGGRFFGSPSPTFIRVRSEAWFPNPVHKGAGYANTRFWKGFVTTTKLAPKTYAMTGTLSEWNPGGYAYMTFANDGTWSCSGNCNFYALFPRRTIKSDYGWGSGTYKLAPAPLPAGALLGASGLLALFGLGFRRRGRSSLGRSRAARGDGPALRVHQI